ncbi:MAG: ABC transporter substrate-binding protein [Deltaproteobacteria bacterium]|nr:ABC transporter substrate-binding protein [Deltaproteobacteria bacterium]
MDTLVVAIPSSPGSLDPRLANDAYGQKINQLIFRGLFQKDEHLNVVPDLAARLDQPSPTTYIVTLQKGVRFHDGSELTADDVVYTIRSILDGEVLSPFKEAFARVKTIIAIDRTTVRIELTEPYAPFLTSLCYGIVPRQAATKLGQNFGRQPIGSGPYHFVRWVDETAIELERHEPVHDARPPHLSFRIIKDDNTRVLMLLKGEIDFVMNAVPPVLLKRIKDEPRLKLDTSEGITMSYVGMNLEDPILRDRRVRQAIALALNRNDLIAYRRYGYASKANSLLAPTNWAYAPNLPQIGYDPAQAKRLLDEAGFVDPDGDGPKKRFTLTFRTSTAKERVDIVRMIALQLADVGIGIDILSYEWGTFFRDIQRGNFQLYSLQWVGVTEPDIYYDVFHSSRFPPAGLNRGKYANAEMDRLVEEGRRSLDPEQRKKSYAKIQSMLLSDVPVIPLWYEQNVAVMQNNISQVHLRPDASFMILKDVVKQ